MSLNSSQFTNWPRLLQRTPLGNPSPRTNQGQLFDPDTLEGDEARANAIQSHAVSTVRNPHEKEHIRKMGIGNDRRKELLDMPATVPGIVMNKSKMPNELIKALGGRMHVNANPNPKTDGFYDVSTGHIMVQAHPDYVSGVGFLNQKIYDGTVTHELGHRADWRSHGAEGGTKHAHKKVWLTDHEYATPRAEGVADGFMDRYSPHHTSDDFSHITQTGYGALNAGGTDDWDIKDRAVYTAVRAHVSKTGELINVDNRPPWEGSKGHTPDPASLGISRSAHLSNTILHKLLATSPHAVRALRTNGMRQEGGEAFDEYRKTRKVGTQLSMFGGDHDVYDIPEDHQPDLSGRRARVTRVKKTRGL